VFITQILLFILAGLLVLAGLAGLVLPAVPGALLILGGLVVAAWAEDFVRVGWAALGVCAGLAVLTYVVDLAATAFGAKRFGASPRAVIGAAVGSLVGIFFGLPGFLLGPFAGAVVGELSIGRDAAAAGRAGIGAWLGLAIGTAGKLALAFFMIGIFVAARLL
jgi:uncharacterized protein YqgC (DUF456 family)